MDLFYSYATDENAEVNGVERKLGADTVLLVARQGNPKASAKWEKETERLQASLESKDADTVQAANIERLVNVLAECILLGWSGVQFKGEDLPYTIENAKTVLALKEFRLAVLNMSSEIDQYRVQQAAATEKNLPTA